MTRCDATLSANGKSETFERWVECTPSRDWRRDSPSRNYGVSNMRVWFYLKGPKGVVQWQIGTEWGIKPVRDHLNRHGPSPYDDFRQPEGWDLGYHSPKPMHEGHTPMDGECLVLGGRCYYDGSSLNADDLIEGFLAGGTDWLWPKLEEYYRCVFEDAEYPDFTAQYKPHPDDANKPDPTALAAGDKS